MSRSVLGHFRLRVTRSALSIAASLVLVASSFSVPVVAAVSAPPTDRGTNLSDAGGPPPANPRTRTADKSKWGPSARTYANSDGTYTLESYGGRVNYKDSGKTWQEIDTTLVSKTAGAYTMATKANDIQLAVSDKNASASLVQTKVGSTTVKLRVPGYGSASFSPLKPRHSAPSKPSKPIVDPEQAVAADGGLLFAGTGGLGNLILTPTTDGFEFGAILPDRNSATTYAYALDTGGLTAVMDADGVSVDLVASADRNHSSSIQMKIEPRA